MNIKRTTLAAASAILAIPFASAAQDEDKVSMQGRMAAETVFETMDAAGTGYVHMGNIEDYRASVFVGMDYDENGKVNYEEFASWDPGFAVVAEELGRMENYTTASKIIFALWDRDADGELTPSEMRFALNADFNRADLDGDGLLSKDEFIQGFMVMVAMRAAIRPDF